MDTIRTFNILGIGFDCIECSQVLQQISRWHTEGQCRAISFVNPHSVIVALQDADMAKALQESSLILSDGIGIVLASRILGCSQVNRITGPGFMLKLCEWSQYYGYSHYFYGGAEGVAEELAEQLKQKYPRLKIAGTDCPPFRNLTPQEEQDVIQKINSSKPDILWVGLGAPKQEKWIHQHLGKIGATAMLGVGAAFDFHSGHRKWAPKWIREMGIEWLYRFLQEPRRMWKRTLNNALFLFCVFGQKLKLCYQTPAPIVCRENAAQTPDIFDELAADNSIVSDNQTQPQPVPVPALKEESL
jgi:N-acetylglucosaminyldiphosphoundecaprenol N-acetyl-beta-D-mannosaminyltransferase